MAESVNLISYQTNELGILIKHSGGQKLIPYHSILDITHSDGNVNIDFSLINNTSITLNIGNRGGDFIKDIFNAVTKLTHE